MTSFPLTCVYVIILCQMQISLRIVRQIYLRANCFVGKLGMGYPSSVLGPVENSEGKHVIYSLCPQGAYNLAQEKTIFYSTLN